jgi:membrane-associated phospholipid phosphatase
MPTWCSHAAQDGILAMVGLSAAASVLSSDERTKTTGMVYMIGLPIVWAFKNIGKRIEHCGCIRPKNQNFCKDTVYYGGCPSGHATYALYTTTLFWKQLGWKWGLPLAAFSAFVTADSVNCNRHYLSQMVAGAGLGVALGLAASRVVDRLMGTDACCSVCIQPDGGCNVTLSYEF